MLGIAGPPRAEPWPYHLMIGGEGYMVATDQNGQLMVSVRPPNQDDVVPDDYGANASNPAFGKWHPYDDFSMGFGQKVQGLYKDRKAFKALGVDTSQKGKLFMGPAVMQVTPGTTDSTNGWLDFFEIGGALYGVVGRYCQKRASDSSFSTTGGHDFGSGKTALKGTCVFKNAGGTQYAFIPMSGSEKAYYFDGTTFAQFATFTAQCFCQVGREFFRASDTNLVSKVDTNADPTNEANWTATNQFRIGDETASIVQMWPTATGVLLILKTDGLYSIAPDGQDIKYYGKFFDHGVTTDNGKVVWTFGSDTYVMFNGGLHRQRPDFTLEPIGPELQPTNDSEITGYISAGLGHSNLNSYGMLYNPDTGNSYLMKFRTYANTRFGLSGNEFPVAVAEPQDAWVGSISQKLSGVKGTAMFESTIGADSGHSRAWIGFSDGSYAYYTLPCVHDPTGCSSYHFSTTTSTLQPPLFTGLFYGNNKVVMSAKVTGTTLTSTSYVQIGYESDPSVGSFTDWGANFTANGQRSDLATPFAGTLIGFQFTFVNGSTSTTPVVTAIELLWALQYDDLRQVYDIAILAEDGLQALDGRPLRRLMTDIRSTLQTAGTATAGMAVVLPDEDSKTMRLNSYGETTVYDSRLRGIHKVIQIKAIEDNTNQVYGTWGRLQAFTWGDLASMDWAQMEML